jgi:hypothetical protein
MPYVISIIIGGLIGLLVSRIHWLHNRVNDLLGVQTRQSSAIVDLERRCEASERELIDLVRAKGNQVALLFSLRRVEKRLGMPQTQLTVSWRPTTSHKGRGMLS